MKPLKGQKHQHWNAPLLENAHIFHNRPLIASEVVVDGSIKDLLGLYVQQSDHFLLLIFLSIKIASISDGRVSSFDNFAVISFLKYTKIPSPWAFLSRR